MKLIISGCNGRMGQVLSRICIEDPDVEIVAGFDVYTKKNFDYPVYADPMEFSGTADAVVDFSNPSALESLLSYCEKNTLPVVLCTTGYSEEQLARIDSAAKIIPIFRSANMSLGINLLAELIARAASVLGDGYDIEIIEKHHNQKVDAPSGTALMLADAVKSVKPESEYVYERQSKRQLRSKNEIGISSIRGGTITGEHEVLFAGLDELIEIKHTIYSREVFASGAKRAAKFLAGKTVPGFYSMNDLIAED